MSRLRLILLSAFLFLSFLVVSGMNFATQHALSYNYVGNDPCNYTRGRFINNNNGTNWQVWSNYRVGRSNWLTPITFWVDGNSSSYGNSMLFRYIPGINDQVLWHTSCVDPQQDVSVSSIDYSQAGSGCTTGGYDIYHTYDVNVTCKQGAGGIYRACDQPNNHGNVGLNEKCPGTPDCARNGRLNVCNEGQNYCGGNNSCDLREHFCNFNNSFGNWCDSRLIDAGSPTCYGNPGCRPLPDLDITAFRFPDGIEGKTSDVRVTIHNRGNTQIPNNFDVTVNNGDPNRGPGWSRTYRVTQTVSADESILLDSHFQNMPLPPVRSNPYTATATVDSARPDEVNESREDNNTATDNYTVFPLINPWFQGVGGDMRDDGGSSVTVPTGEYFSITQGALSSPGIIFNYNISGNLSSKNWKVSGSNFAGRSIKTSYDYVTGAIKKGGITTFGLFGRKSPCGPDDKPNCNLNGNSQDIEKGFYTYNGSPPLNVTINGNYNFQGGGYYVFVINGNLTINSNRLTVAKDGTSVLFVVSGNITVSDNVTNLEGIFSADGNFRVNSKTPATDNQLEIQGSVIANSVKGVGKFDNQRDLGNRANITTPAVVIIYRPDLILNAPNLIRSTNYKFQEVAPRGNP